MTDDSQDWEAVTSFLDLREAEIACAFLQSEGIDCYVHGAHHRGMLGFIGRNIIEPRLMVRSDEVARAKELLATPVDKSDASAVHTSELAELKMLVVNLSDLTLFTLGAGASRWEIVKLVGPPTSESPSDEGGVELRYANHGAIIFLDETDRMDGFLVIVSPSTDFPEIIDFPGFWEPGGTARPPSRWHLVDTLGKPAREEEQGGRVCLEWQPANAGIYVTLDRRDVITELEVEFKSAADSP
jgi:hypothetical protein